MSSASLVAPVSLTSSQSAGKLELRSFVPARTADAPQQFEAFVLQTFVEQLLPKDVDSVYGGGAGGSYWKSMLSEKLAEVLAARGDFGIAQYLRNGSGSGTAVGSPTQVQAELRGAVANKLSPLLDAALSGAHATQTIHGGE